MHAGLPTGTPTAPDSAQRSGAPSIDATGPISDQRSGDDPTIPLVEIVLRRDRLAGDPAFAQEPPPPYQLRDHRPGDAAAWVHIHRLAEPFHDVDEALYLREFGGAPDSAELLRARQLFLCDAHGDAIGTATAWPPQPGVDPRLGRVHWVAIAPPHQGRGLMRPLMAALCRRFLALGYEGAYLTTEAPRLRALRGYLSLGFLPDLSQRTGADAAARAAWREVAKRLPLPAATLRTLEDPE